MESASLSTTPASRGPFRLLADLREIGHDIWDYRELLHHLALRDIKLRYKQAVMGFGWALFMPVFIVAAGMIIRFAMAHLSGGALIRTEVAGLVVKALPWAFFIGAIGMATSSLTTNANLVGKVYFPREVLPLAVVLAQGLDLLVGGAVVLILLPFLGVSLSLQQLWLLPLAALLVMFTAGVSLFLACANLFFRDVKYIVQVLLTFGIFMTPVIYEPAMLGARGARLIMFNPMSPILEGFRLSLIEGHNLLQPLVVTGPTGAAIVAWDPWVLAYGVGASVLALVASALLFHRSEFAFAEYV
jgi:ABC-type polysaccharide/polyol phosphate export permease